MSSFLFSVGNDGRRIALSLRLATGSDLQVREPIGPTAFFLNASFQLNYGIGIYVNIYLRSSDLMTFFPWTHHDNRRPWLTS